MSKKRILATTITAILSTGMIAAGMGSVFAADHDGKSKMSTEKNGANEMTKQDKELIKVSEDAMLSMRDVADARLAIFDGQPAKARTEVDAALTRINTAVNEAKEYAVDVKAPKQDDWYIPFDTRVTMLDTFEPENGKADNPSGKTNRHVQMNMHKRNQNKASEMFKLSDVDVAVSAGLVPVKFAQQHIIEAANLINKGNYYEANMALKAVDDAVIVHTVAADEMANDDTATDKVG